MSPPSLPLPRSIDPVEVDRRAADLERLDLGAAQFDPVWQGRRLRWRRWGVGSPLVLVHGGHGSWLHWIGLIANLAQHHAVWVPDLPGYGDSEDPPLHRHSPARQAWLLEATGATWRELIGPTPTALVGFSFGGLVASELATSGLPVTRLALIGTAGHQTPRRPMAPLANWRVADRRRSLTLLDINLRAFMIHDAGRADALALLAHERASRATRFRSRDLSMAADLRTILARYQGKLRLIWGQWDMTAASPPQAARRLAEACPGLDWHEIAGAGHWVQQEAPEAVLGLLEDWLEA